MADIAMRSKSNIPRVQLLDATRFQGVVGGEPVSLYTLRNSRGMVACITNYGAKIEQLLVPGGDGQLTDVVLGYDSLEAVIGGSPSMGAFIGRYAGRIGAAAFTLDGASHQLTANNGLHCLHGGLRGSRFRVYQAVQRNDSSVEMSCLFADGEEGFPGSLMLRLTYSLSEANELVLSYEAMALDKPTVASFTTHAFFNLNGPSADGRMGDVLDHELTIYADRYFATSAQLVATGGVLPVTGTALDFCEPALLGQRLHREDSVLASNAVVQGYDHCYLLKPSAVHGVSLAARVRSCSSGLVMEVWSTEPAMQLYTGLQAGEPLAGGPGKTGHAYLQQQSLCLEPQGYPNAPNCAAFPSSVHRPGESRGGKTLYRFSAR